MLTKKNLCNTIKLTFWPRSKRYTWKIVTRGYIIYATRGYNRKANALRAARNSAAKWNIAVKTESVTTLVLLRDAVSCARTSTSKKSRFVR